MHRRGDLIAQQDCLIGMACRDMVPLCDAGCLGLSGEHACNPEHPWCAAPSLQDRAYREWAECSIPENLDFKSVIPIPRLPACIWNLSAREKLDDSGGHRVIAAKLTDIGGILSKNGPKLAAWRQSYGISSATALLVHQESIDRLQERLGVAAGDQDFFDHLRLLGGRIVFVSPGYSVYDDGSMCPVRQVLNMRRSLHEAARANRAGLPAIPTLGWNARRPEDLEFLADWLKRQGRYVRTLAVNAQTGTSSNALGLALGSGMVELERLADSSFHWVVFGGRKKVEAICEFLPRSRITQVSRPKDFTGIDVQAAIVSTLQLS